MSSGSAYAGAQDASPAASGGVAIGGIAPHPLTLPPFDLAVLPDILANDPL